MVQRSADLAMSWHERGLLAVRICAGASLALKPCKVVEQLPLHPPAGYHTLPCTACCYDA
jgi:hypothetical protein